MPLDPSIVLLVGAETSLVDESSYARTLTAVGNAARTTAQAKYGSASITFDGTGDHIKTPDATEFAFGGGNFTVEGWFRFVTKTDSQALFGQWDNGGSVINSSWFLFIVFGSLTLRLASAAGGGTTTDIAATWAPTLGTWYHIAADRAGTTVRLYVNGAVIASNTSYSAALNDSAADLTLGAIGTTGAFAGYDYNGQMDEVRLTKGVAQYAGAFTPPTSPFSRGDGVIGAATIASGSSVNPVIINSRFPVVEGSATSTSGAVATTVPTVVQTSPKATSTGATVSVTFTTPPTVGKAIVVQVWGRVSTPGSMIYDLRTVVTDNYGNTYFIADNSNDGLGATAVFYCRAVAATGVGFTITVDNSFLSPFSTIIHQTAIAQEISTPLTLAWWVSKSGAAATVITVINFGSVPQPGYIGTLPLFEVATLSLDQTVASITPEVLSPTWTPIVTDLDYSVGCVGSGLCRSGLLAETPQQAKWTLGTAARYAGTMAHFVVLETTVHTVSLPTGIVAGELLMIAIGMNSDACQPIVTWPTGWAPQAEELLTNTQGSAGTRLERCPKIALLTKYATGSEGSTVTFTTDIPRRSTHITYRISNFKQGQLAAPLHYGKVSTFSAGSVTAIVPIISPFYTAKQFLWFGIVIWDDVGVSITANPTAFDASTMVQSLTAGGTAGVGIRSTSMNLEALQSPNAQSYTLSAARQYRAMTIAIWPDEVDALLPTTVPLFETTWPVAKEASGAMQPASFNRPPQGSDAVDTDYPLLVSTETVKVVTRGPRHILTTDESVDGWTMDAGATFFEIGNEGLAPGDPAAGGDPPPTGGLWNASVGRAIVEYDCTAHVWGDITTSGDEPMLVALFDADWNRCLSLSVGFWDASGPEGWWNTPQNGELRNGWLNIAWSATDSGFIDVRNLGSYPLWKADIVGKRLRFTITWRCATIQALEPNFAVASDGFFRVTMQDLAGGAEQVIYSVQGIPLAMSDTTYLDTPVPQNYLASAQVGTGPEYGGALFDNERLRIEAATGAIAEAEEVEGHTIASTTALFPVAGVNIGGPALPWELGFFIDGVQKNSILGDYSITHTLGSRRNLSFGLTDYDGTYTPEIGDPVWLTILSDGIPLRDRPDVTIPSGTLIREFSGSLDQYSQDKPLDGAVQLVYSCTAVGLEQLADRQIVAEVYETTGQTLRDIVLDLRIKYLMADNITATVDTVDLGPVLGRMVFPYQDLTSVFNQLGDLSGYSWWIDDIAPSGRVLYFRDRTSVPAPFAITDANNKSVGLAVSRSRAEYRNRQYVRGGQALSAMRTDILLGQPDGVRKSFDVTYPIAATPVVLVNGVTKTVGVAGHDRNVDWYWSKGQTHVEQDPDAYPLIINDILTVSYQWLFPLLTVYDDTTEQGSRAVAEGGSGIYAQMVDDSSITDMTLLIDTAVSQVQRHRLPTTISFMTRIYGLRPGMIISAQAAGFDIDAQFLITETRQNSIFHSLFEYLVTAVSGDATGTSWVEFYRRLAAAKREQMFKPDGSNETLLLARGYADAVACSDSVGDPVSGVQESRIDFAQIGYGEIG